MKKQTLKNQELFFAFYLGIGNATEQKAIEYIKNTQKYLAEFKEKHNIFIIPTRENDSHVECLNPVKISEDEYKLLEIKVEEMNNKLNEFLNKI